LQTVWAHAELIRRATDPSTLSIEDVGIHHRGAYIVVSPSVKVAAGGAGGGTPDLRGPEFFGDEVDDALLGLEGPGDAEKRGGLGEDGVLS